MATSKTTTSVPQQVENLVEAAVTLGTSLVRLGASVIVIPLSLLPAQARQDTVQIAQNVIDSVGRVNLSVFKIAGKASEDWLKELDTALSKAAKPAAPAQTVIIDEAPAKK